MQQAATESRMGVHRTHEKQVLAWEEMNTQGLRPEQIAQLFGSAIHAIEQRSLLTLSSVTVQIVADRVLHESREKFPILSLVQTESGGLNFNSLIQTCERSTVTEVGDALRYLLVELLSVIGNITADVLTAPLHKELMRVTWQANRGET